MLPLNPISKILHPIFSTLRYETKAQAFLQKQLKNF